MREAVPALIVQVLPRVPEEDLCGQEKTVQLLCLHSICFATSLDTPQETQNLHQSPLPSPATLP